MRFNFNCLIRIPNKIVFADPNSGYYWMSYFTHVGFSCNFSVFYVIWIRYENPWFKKMSRFTLIWIRIKKMRIRKYCFNERIGYNLTNIKFLVISIFYLHPSPYPPPLNLWLLTVFAGEYLIDTNLTVRKGCGC